MARRPDPERIDLARRLAVRSRLTGDGLSEERAEAWLFAWEAVAETEGLDRHSSTFWERGVAWIARERAARNAPTANRGPLPRP